MSKNIENSEGINESYGINESFGVNRSEGINWSEGINGSDGVSCSKGINWSNGVNESFGVIYSYGVDHAMFCADKERTYSLFGKGVSKERFNEVWHNLHQKLGNWYPKFNNAFELYLKEGKDCKKVKASKITDTLEDWEKPYEAWKDMPQEAIDYLKDLPEFDGAIFKRVTGIDVETHSGEMVEIDGKKFSKSTIKEALKGYINEN